MAWDSISFGVYEDGPDAGLEYAANSISWDKAHRLNLKNNAIRTNGKQIFSVKVRANPEDPLCTVKLLKFFRSICHPSQKRVFCKKASESQLKDWRLSNEPYQYNPNQPVGENTINKGMKYIAQLCGFEDFNKCTNHGNRALGITIAVSNGDKNVGSYIQKNCRHPSITSHAIYQRENPLMEKKKSRCSDGPDFQCYQSIFRHKCWTSSRWK